MSKLLFKLNGVTDEEANEVRALFEENQINVYETNAGRWGLSIAAIWLNDDEYFDQAKALLDQYQQQRVMRIRAEGIVPESLASRIGSAPLHYGLMIVAIIAVLFISLAPFLTID